MKKFLKAVIFTALFFCVTVIAGLCALSWSSAADDSVFSAGPPSAPDMRSVLMFAFGTLAVGYFLAACVFYRKSKRRDGGARQEVPEDPDFFGYQSEQSGYDRDW